MLDQMSDVWWSLSASYEGMGGQILGAMPENLAPCLSLRKIEILGNGVDHDKRKKHCDSHRSAFNKYTKN